MIKNIDKNDVVLQIRQSIVQGDLTGLKSVVDDYGTFCFKENHEGRQFDNQVFELIVEMMHLPLFLDMPGADKLLILLEFDWALLTPSQKLKLLDAIEYSYDKYKDWMACYLLSQLLGEYFCDEKAFHLLCKLRSLTKDVPRSFLPMAFEYLAQGASDLFLRNESLAMLEKMIGDPSAAVQREAAEALDRIRKGVAQ